MRYKLPLLVVAGAALGCLINLSSGAAQDIGDPDEPPKEEKKAGGTLKPRPETDADAEAWVGKFSAPKPTPLSVDKGVVLYHTLSPDGSRLYFYRNLKRKPSVAEPRDSDEFMASAGQYVLCAAGIGAGESRVMETGIDCNPPLFLPDGRLVVTVRKLDTDGDGEVNELDEHALVVCNADGGNPYEVDSLAPTETALAVWKDGKEVLLADFARHDVNGWINTLPLVRGKKRSPVVKGFNVEMVLPDGKLLIERKQAPPVETQPNDPWRWRWNPPDPDEIDEQEGAKEAVAGLLDACEHVIFNPADGSEVPLYSPSQRSRLVVHAEGSFFGHQEYPRQGSNYYDPWNGYTRRTASLGFELCIVDDKDHRDTKIHQPRYDYLALGWLEGRGLLVAEHGRLSKHLLLLDRSLKFHELATFEFDVRGFACSADGGTVAYLVVEDTNKNGALESWLDESRPHIIKLPKR